MIAWIHTLTLLDRRILQALTVSPRASFRDLGRAVGTTGQSVARSYRAMQAELGLRVTGRLSEDRLGWERWVLRITANPGIAGPLAGDLAGRADTRWVRSGLGGTEIVCGVQTPTGEHNALAPLLARIYAAHRSCEVDAHLVIREFSPAAPAWLAGALTEKEVESLSALAETSVRLETLSASWTRSEQVLLGELKRDGRATAAHLAAVTGWHESTVRRRVAQLSATGVLSFDLDLADHALGSNVTAQLWVRVDVAHLEDVAEAVSTHREASFVAVVSGLANLLVSAACEDTAHLYTYLAHSLGRLEGVTSVETVPVDRTYKQNAPA